MQITKIQYGLTVKDSNDNYKKAHLEAELTPQDVFVDIKSLLMKEVEAMVGVAVKSTSVKKEAPKKEAPKTVTKKTAVTKKAAPKEEVAKTEEKEEKKPAPRRATRAATKKTTAYDREVKAHKTHLKNLLNDRFPEWAQPGTELNDNAKAASTGLVGVDLLDASGNVLDSFIEALDALMVGDNDGL